MKTLPLLQQDSAGLVTLWNASARFDPVTEDLLHEKIWADPGFDDSLGIALELAGKQAGFGCGVIRQRETQRVGYIKLLAVTPACQGQGLGRTLVNELESRLWQQGVDSIRVAESAPNYLFPGVDVRYTRAMLMFEALGYQRVGDTYNLTAELVGRDFTAEARTQELQTQGITIRRATGSDESAIGALLDECWPSWRPEVLAALRNEPPTLHIALSPQGVIGFSAHDSNNLGTAWFGPMGTHPVCRGHGIGQVLLCRCLADMQSQGHTRTIIPWVGPVKFYARHVNAEIERVFYRYEKSRVERPAGS